MNSDITQRRLALDCCLSGAQRGRRAKNRVAVHNSNAVSTKGGKVR